jgi:hypothetical protein
MDNNIGKIDVFNTLYEVQNISFLNNFLKCRNNISYSNIFENINNINIQDLKILIILTFNFKQSYQTYF